MSWDDWGLKALADDASSEAVLRTRTRWLALGVDPARAAIVDELSERWFVSAVVIADPPDVLRPAAGDVVVWRADRREDHSRPTLWGGPTSVLSVADTDDGDIEVRFLEDMQHHGEDSDSEDDDRYLLVLQDRVLRPGEIALLARKWDMYLCPYCGAHTREIVYGLPSPDLLEDEDVALGGCLIWPNPLLWECSSCRSRF